MSSEDALIEYFKLKIFWGILTDGMSEGPFQSCEDWSLRVAENFC